MKRRGGERLQLIFQRVHVLHGPKGDDHERIFLAQTEAAHVALMQSDLPLNVPGFGLHVRFQDSQHRRRIVHTRNRNALAGYLQQHAPGAAGDFENGPAGLPGQIEVKGQIDKVLLRGVSSVVML